MFRVVGLGRGDRIPRGVPVPENLAEALRAERAGAPRDGGVLGLLGGPETTDPYLATVERWGREAGVTIEVAWGEPLGRVVRPEGATVVFGGDLLPGELLVPGPGDFEPYAHGLFDQDETMLFFEDLRRPGRRVRAGDLKASRLGPLSAVFRVEGPRAAAIVRIQTIMAALLGERGCPWDRKQDHLSLRRYLLEEAGEAVDALTEEDAYKTREEMGDLLLQILFHSLLYEKEGRFDFTDVANGLSDKLVRRHPHVFGEEHAKDPRWVVGRWQRIKREESRGERSLVDEVPRSLGALEAFGKVLALTDRLGIEIPPGGGVGGAIAALARQVARSGEDPALALRATVRTYLAGITSVEETARSEGVDLDAVDPKKREATFMKGVETFLNRKKED